MKKVFYSVVLLGLVLVAVSSCEKNHNPDNDSSANIEARTKALGFSDVDAYEESVTEHSGTNHGGTHHDGAGYAAHENGESHNSANHHNE